MIKPFRHSPLYHVLTNHCIPCQPGGGRKSVDSVMRQYNIASRFIKDPIDLGGDGQPGFNCAKCNPLQRVIEFIDPVKADVDENYCHAGIAAVDVLEVFQSHGQHCDKILVGQPLAYVANGFPISSEFSVELISLFLTLKNKGVYEEKKAAAKPTSTCSLSSSNGPTPLNVYDLVAIWICTALLASIGICVSIWERRQTLVKQSMKISSTAKRLSQTRRSTLQNTQVVHEESAAHVTHVSDIASHKYTCSRTTTCTS